VRAGGGVVAGGLHLETRVHLAAGRVAADPQLVVPRRLACGLGMFALLDAGRAGVTDQFGALDHLRQRGELRPGQRIVMTGIGIGFNGTTAVLEIVEQPDAASEV
jgi:3-oxoacyl-[acyl-carrier-protein] synthase-3